MTICQKNLDLHYLISIVHGKRHKDDTAHLDVAFLYLWPVPSLSFIFFRMIKLMSVFLTFLPLALAQGSAKISIEVPPNMVFDQEYSVVIELQDQDGKPLTDVTPTIVFVPTKSVEAVDLFDCSEPEEYDNCKPNNRGVEGVFESLFTIVDSPVTMTVSASGTIKQVTVEAQEAGAEELASVSSDEEVKEVVEVPKTPAASASEATLQPGDIQAGPSPLVTFFLLPLALILAVVTYFVVTTE